VKFYTRRGYDWTPRFKNLIDPIVRLKADYLILDEQVIVEAPNGTSDFGALESDLAKGGSDRLVFYAFDLLYIDGWDLRKCALLDRKTALAELIGGATGPLRYSEHLAENGAKVFQQACDLKLEGVVSKRGDARYTSGRTNTWTKSSCRKRETLVIAGVAFRGSKFDGVYLGRKEDGKLTYAGKVERGFSEQSVADLVARVSKLRTRTQPLTKKINKPKAMWLKPPTK
jgi:bifunctional non-homologous end joining protein LigD